jgi:hypothetical protein
MVVRDDVLYAGFPGGKLVALDATNGAQLWETTVALPRGATELERVADVMGNPGGGRAAGVRRRLPGPRGLLRPPQRRAAVGARHLQQQRAGDGRAQCLRHRRQGRRDRLRQEPAAAPAGGRTSWRAAR